MDFSKDFRVRSLSLFLIIVLVISYVYFRLSVVSIELYVMVMLFFFVMFIGLISGIERGLIGSLFAIFGYGTYLIVLRLYYPWKYQFNTYDLFWILFIPVGAWGSGGINKVFYLTYNSLKRIENSIESFFTVDVETGLDDRKRFVYELETEAERAKRYNSKFGLLLIRIDLLKEFEAQYGTEAKNKLIKVVTERLNRYLRLEDRKGRLAENEFAAILLELRQESVETVRKRLKENLSFIDLEVRKDVYRRIKVHLKMGIALYPEDGEDFPTLYSKAEKDFEFDVR